MLFFLCKGDSGEEEKKNVESQDLEQLKKEEEEVVWLSFLRYYCLIKCSMLVTMVATTTVVRITLNYIY